MMVRMALAVLVCFLLIGAGSAQESAPSSPAFQYAKIPVPTGGINTASTGPLAENEASELSNFLIEDGELVLRQNTYELYGSGVPFTESPSFMRLYRKSYGASRLLIKSGSALYLQSPRADSLKTEDRIIDTIYARGAIDLDSNTRIATADEDTAAQWRSIMGTGGDLILYVDTSGGGDYGDFPIEYIQHDHKIVLDDTVTGFASLDGAAYHISGGLGEPTFGQQFNDELWLLSSSGLWGVNDRTLTNYEYDTTFIKLYYDNTTYLQASTKFGEAGYRSWQHSAEDGSGGVSTLAALSLRRPNQVYAFIDSTAGVGPGAESSVDAGDTVYMMWPVLRIEEGYKNNIYVGGRGVPVSPSDGVWHRSFHVLKPDHNSYRTFDADSLVWDDSTMFIWADTVVDFDMGAGNWFVVPGDTVVDTGDVWKWCVASDRDDGDSHWVAPMHWLAEDDVVSDTTITFYQRVTAGNLGGRTCGAFWSDRLCSVSYDTPAQIDFSKDFVPDTLSDYFVQVDPDDGEPITYMTEMYGILIIAKPTKIYKLTGIPGLDAYARLDKAWDGHGFLSAEACVNTDGVIFGLAHDGFYVYDFNSMVRVSDKISNIVRDSINWDRVDLVDVSIFDGNYWVSYPLSGSNVNNRILVFNPDYQAWSSITDLQFSGFNDVCVEGWNPDSANVFLVGPPTSSIFAYGGTAASDEFVNTATWVTGWLDFGAPWYQKSINRIGVTGAGLSATIGGYTYIDDGTAATAATGSLTPNYPSSGRAYAILKTDIDGTRSYRHKFKLSGLNQRDLRIGEFWVEYLVQGIDY